MPLMNNSTLVLFPRNYLQFSIFVVFFTRLPPRDVPLAARLTGISFFMGIARFSKLSLIPTTDKY